MFGMALGAVVECLLLVLLHAWLTRPEDAQDTSGEHVRSLPWTDGTESGTLSHGSAGTPSALSRRMEPQMVITVRGQSYVVTSEAEIRTLVIALSALEQMAA
jgi:hypothetical protein